MTSKSFSGWIGVLVASLVIVSVTSARAEDSDVDISGCGHLDEMEAGRAALVAGEREEALDHFRAARKILVECERQAEASATAEERPALGRDLI